MLKDIDFSEPGYIVKVDNYNRRVKQNIADMLRVADIPIGLTHTQVDGLRLQSNLLAIIIRTLVAREVLDEQFTDELGMDWDLEHIIYALEQMGGSYEEPDLDNVEDA